MSVTDRERAETALVKAGFVWKSTGLTIDCVPFAYLERWHDHRCDCAYLYEDGTYHLDLRGNTSDLPSLLSPPTLTPEKVDEVLREALSLWFAKHSSIELKDDNMFRNFVIARLRDVVSPTLTEEERKALEWGMELMGDCQGADTLRSILAHFGGESRG